MTLQTTNSAMSSAEAYDSIRSNAYSAKVQGQNALASMQAGSVNSDFIFRMLDQLNSIIAALNKWSAITGLDNYATGQGYVGSMVADCASAVTAAQTCITWVVTSFPASGGYLLSHILNSDGSRTPRSFTSTQTAGLQTDLQAFIATIG